MKKTALNAYIKKRNRKGYLFILPWFVGAVSFFLPSIFKMIVYSFNTVDVRNLNLSFIGFDNFIKAFRQDLDFPVLYINAITTNLAKIPIVIIFSYFVALLLRKNYRGSTFFKVVFFLTVILNSEMFIRLQIDTSFLDVAHNEIIQADNQQLFNVLGAQSLTEYLVRFGITQNFIDYINSAIQSLQYIIISSGIQIFLFLAALHTIPESMYESASMEGATAWELFWKVTLPMTSPIILVVLVYTIVDTFSSPFSGLFNYIQKIGFESFNYGYFGAIALIFFITIGLLFTIVFLIFKKLIFYQD